MPHRRLDGFRGLTAILPLPLLLASSCASGPGLRQFSSDGCSAFLDGTLFDRDQWRHCCYEHDKAYWRGGTKQQRRVTDAGLRECVTEVHSNVLGFVMYDSVRVGGAPWWPVPYRWGYGWPYGRGYRPLTTAERERADSLMATFEAENPPPALNPD